MAMLNRNNETAIVRNYVWVRTELVEAIWENNGKQPQDWTPSNRKRGRDSSALHGWGWIRAVVVQSSSTHGLSSSRQIRGRPRLFGADHSRGRGNTANSLDESNGNTLVTVTIDDEEFAPRHLQEVTVSLSYNSSDNEFVCNTNTWWARDVDPPEDLTSLTHLHEPAVVYCLQRRYENEKIYTYTGKILLALNPFRVLNGLYGDKVMQRYWETNHQHVERKEPHIYAIAQDAYRLLMQMGEDQSILVSGESGSGKTVTTKLILGYLASQSKRLIDQKQHRLSHDNDKEGIESQLLESNPILESFGNARTVRNDNSSRFGKFMELLFNPSGSLLSASIETYLLEKVRLISQSPGERNYHVFYELLAGVPQKERQELEIANVTVRDFRMTCTSGTFDRRDGLEDRDTYRDLCNALNTVGFSPDEQHDLISVACALLHISNLTFRTTTSTEDASELVNSNPSLRPAIKLFGVPVEALNNALCLCAIQARGEVFHKNMSIAQACKAVEALIKATYGAMFTHIVRRVNSSIAVDQNPGGLTDKIARIGVLDIFGFESFEVNSFEQLCINYCNEALQQQFNRFIFKLEQKEYEQEGIEWSFISFPDNQEILDLIEKKRDGILSILDEQSRLTSCTDESFCNAVYDKCNGHPRFTMSKTQKVQLRFSIQHYAGIVTYDIIDFREKNKDELPKETTELLISSSVPFLVSLGEILSQSTSASPASSPMGGSPSNNSMSSFGSSRTNGSSSRSHGFSSNANSPTNKRSRGSNSLIRESVGSQFSRQLRELRDRIDCTTPHYVRCLKPNDDLVPHQFETHVIADQLRCAGVLEAIRVSRVGFPHRYYHDRFLQRYEMIASQGWQSRKRGKDRCKELMRSLLPQIRDVIEHKGIAGSSSEQSHRIVSLGVQAGRTKVFLRRQVFEALELLRTRRMEKAATIIQSNVRRFLAQFHFIESLIAILILQCFARRIAAVREANRIRYFHSAVTIQTVWRRFYAETELMAARLIARFGQTYWRGAIARELFSILRVERQAVLIQRCWRRYYSESWFCRVRIASLIAQSLWRRKMAIAVVKQVKREARSLGNVTAERDRFKEESMRLRQQVEHLKRSNSNLDVPQDDEVERLRNEVERLQRALAEAETHSKDGRPVASVPTTVSSGTSPSWLSGVFGGKKGETSSQASSSTFSPLPVIQRVIYGKNSAIDKTQCHSPDRSQMSVISPLKQADFSSGLSSTSVSLLDTEGEASGIEYISQPLDDFPSRQLSFGRKDMVKPVDGMKRVDHVPLPVAERRGEEFRDQLERLHDAVIDDDLQTLKCILSQSDDPHVLVNETGARGRTALHVAVHSSNLRISRTLISFGAIVNAQDEDGETPLHFSVGAPMTTLLLDEAKANPNIPNVDGIVALHLAVRRRDVGSVRALLHHHAQVDTADNVRWFTPLHLIALSENDEKDGNGEGRSRARVMIANLLCSAGGSSLPDLNYQDNQGNAPVHYAAQMDTADACELVNVFLDKGADPSLENNRKQSPLLLLCHNIALRNLGESFQECLHCMLFHGADPNRQSQTGCTPLHLSLYHRDVDSAVQLVNRGAELHLLWKKPKRWHAFWDDLGSTEILPLDMLQDEHSIHRLLAAIVRQPKFAPFRPWCMNCKSQLGAFARAVHCRHCGRNVCGACARRSLSSEYFPKTFEIYEASWVCIVCERILLSRKEDNSISTSPISSDDEKLF